MADYTIPTGGAIPFAPTSYQRPERYTNPYVGTLLDLMQQQTRAQAAVDAQRQALAGQRWQGIGSAASGIAQAFAEAPERRRQAEMQRLRDEQLLQQMAEATTEREDTATLRSALSLPDVAQAESQLSQLGKGYLIPQVRAARLLEQKTAAEMAQLARDEAQRQANMLTQQVQRMTRTAPLLQRGVPQPGPTPAMLPVGPGFISALPPETQAGAQAEADTMIARQQAQGLEAKRAMRLSGEIEPYRQFFPTAPAAMAESPLPITGSGDLDFTRAIQAMEAATPPPPTLRAADTYVNPATGARFTGRDTPSGIANVDTGAVVPGAIKWVRADNGPKPDDPRKELLQQQQQQARAKVTADAMDKELDRLMSMNAETKKYELTPSAKTVVGIGFGRLGRLAGDIFGSDALRAIEGLTSQRVLQEIQEMKQQSRTGATGLGQITERELQILENASALLNTAQSEEQFLERLQSIKAAVTKLHTVGTSTNAPPPRDQNRKNPFN